MGLVKRLRVLLLFALLIGLFRVVDRSFHRIGGRPLTSKMQILLSQPITSSDKDLPTHILTQNFSYLGKGSQAWVFLSEDKKYVLKFYKQHIYKPSSFLAYLPWGPWKAEWLDKRKKYQRVLESTHTAFMRFKEETGLLYVHLLPSTDLQRNVKLFDKRGKEHLISLDKTAFVIQKKADLLYPHITDLMQKGDIEGAKQSLTSISSLLKNLGKLGVVDNDPILRKNFGFIEGRAAQIDVGKMRIDPTQIGACIDLKSISSSLRTWLMKTHPSLVSDLDQLTQPD